MAITKENYLHIQKGGTTYLLLRSTTHFHLVRADVDLKESTLVRLMRIYPCDTDQLSKLGVHFSAFKVESLRGVVIKGYQTGDELELWLGNDVRKYHLGSDYTEDLLAAFFSGYLITKRLPPAREGLDPGVNRKVTWTVNLTAIICSLLFLMAHSTHKLLGVLCIFLQLSIFAIVFLFPDSFTLAEIKKTDYSYRKYQKGQLWLGLLTTGLALSIRTLADFTFSNSALLPLLGISCIVFLILFIPILWVGRNAPKRITASVSTMILVMLLGLGTIGHLNYALDFHDTPSQMAEVVDKQVSTGYRSTYCCCIVRLPNGELAELSVSLSKYRNIDIGDTVTVTDHEGAFHIPFSILEIIPEDP